MLGFGFSGLVAQGLVLGDYKRACSESQDVL